ncbi:MAG: PorT family protein [Cyclobacteriaceae bacterium]|nr:PorT family protein [Cyclobacteriaceae bacterium]
MKKLYLILLFSASTWSAWAQTTSCAQSVRLAQSVYDQGRLHELEDLITKALNNPAAQCGQAEQISLLKLLTLTYIYLEEPQKADATMLKLLQTDHYFQINEAVDPAEFVALYRTFRTKEIYRIGATLGVNASQPNVINTISAVELDASSKYKYGIGIQFGVSADVPLQVGKKKHYRLTLHGELLYMQHKFELEQKVNKGVNLDGVELFQTLQAAESQNWLTIPISAQYAFTRNEKLNPYIAGGFSVGYLMGNGTLRAERFRDEAAAIPETSFNLLREKINMSALVAAGIKSKVGGGYVVLEARYMHGLSKVSTSETAYQNQQAAWGPYYADSVFKLSSLSISGSYIINMFNPKKLRNRS